MYSNCGTKCTHIGVFSKLKCTQSKLRICSILSGHDRSSHCSSQRMLQNCLAQWSTVIYLSYNRNQTFQTASNSRLPPKQLSISQFKTFLLLTSFTSPINPHFSLFIPDLFAEDGSRVGFPPSHLGGPPSPPCPSLHTWCQPWYAFMIFCQKIFQNGDMIYLGT